MNPELREKRAKLYETHIRAAIEEGLNREQIAATLGMTNMTLKRYCDHLGIRIPRKPILKDPSELKINLEEVVFLRGQGQTLQQIGDHYGVTREYIRQILAKKMADVVIPKMRSKTCSICGSQHNSQLRHDVCSEACAAAHRRKNAYNRDTMLILMASRDAGKTWYQTAEDMGFVHTPAWRVQVRRMADTLMSKAEIEHYFPARCSDTSTSEE